jgi:hypothetical protein
MGYLAGLLALGSALQKTKLAKGHLKSRHGIQPSSSSLDCSDNPLRGLNDDRMPGILTTRISAIGLLSLTMLRTFDGVYTDLAHPGSKFPLPGAMTFNVQWPIHPNNAHDNLWAHVSPALIIANTTQDSRRR